MQKLLLVEDNTALREQMKWALTDMFEVCEAGSARECIEMFEEEKPSVVCLDMGLDDIPHKGLELIDEMLTRDRQVKIVVITANTAGDLGARSIQKGAFDYFNKPVDIDKLRVVLERASRVRELEVPVEKQQETKALESDADGMMIGASGPMQQVFEMIRRLGKNDVNVLIIGESGTGKELCARAIHYHSSRKEYPFVPINCGAIPENLIESELFGYVRGAFTGANTDKVGLIESAHQGTILLDEIGEMPKNLQVKLLRFLEDQKLQRLGDTKFREVDVRIIAATNRRDIGREDSECMRSDLYFRLSEFQIDLPPLREREGDTVLIARAIIDRNRSRFDMPRLTLSPRAEQLLGAYSWPGNVRELENKLSRATITCLNQTIEPEDLQLSASSLDKLTLRDARDMFEKEYIINVLRQANFVMTETAKIAGISRPTLYDLMKKHKIEIKSEHRIVQ
ncbi:MAG: sigma-54-dependent transcriptional regulator [Chitinivibrionales bacterium]